MSNLKSQVLADALEASTNATAKAAEKIVEGNRCRTAQAGRSHPLWLLGHLANTNNFLINMCCCGGASLLPKEYNKRFAPDFAGGDPIDAEASKYPAWDEVLVNYKKVSEACVKGVRAMSDQDLTGDLKNAPDRLKETFGTIEKTIRGMVLHDSHHRGQLALLGALK